MNMPPWSRERRLRAAWRRPPGRYSGGASADRPCPGRTRRVPAWRRGGALGLLWWAWASGLVYAQGAAADCGGGPLRGRTPAVVAAITHAVPTTDACASVDAPRLARIKDLRIHGLTALQRQDLAGLTGLHYLFLNHGALTTLPAGAFAELIQLRRLDLSDNRLRALPAGAFAGLSRLYWLDLYNNPLASVPPDAFAGLSALDELRLTLVPAAAGALAPPFTHLPRLRRLDLSHSRLATLPAGFLAGPARLESVDLQSSRLTALPAGLFAAAPSIGALDLSHNRLAALPAGLFAAAPSIGALDLSHNRLAALPAGLFAAAPSIGALDLSHNRLAALPAGLFAAAPSIGALDLSHNRLTALPAGLFCPLPQLFALRLRHNRLPHWFPAAVCDAPTLGTLDLSHNRLAALPADLFARWPRLQILAADGHAPHFLAAVHAVSHPFHCGAQPPQVGRPLQIAACRPLIHHYWQWETCSDPFARHCFPHYAHNEWLTSRYVPTERDIGHYVRAYLYHDAYRDVPHESAYAGRWVRFRAQTPLVGPVRPYDPDAGPPAECRWELAALPLCRNAPLAMG